MIKKLEEKYITQDFLDCLNSLRPTDITIEKALKIFKNMPLIYVAIIDEKVVGTATLILEQKFIRNGAICGHIEDVAVHSTYQNKGIGKQLINKLIEVAKENKCYKVILDCNADLIDYYQKLGFKPSDFHMRLDF